MASLERFNLRWDAFEANARASLMELREEIEFSDITLVSGDGKQVKTNKLILAGGSSFFHQILRDNPHPHPLIYLKQVGHKHLLSVLDFLYTGEASIDQDDLNQFLHVAEDLKVKGLNPSDKQAKSLSKPNAPFESRVAAEDHVAAKIKTYHPSSIPISQGQVASEEEAPAESKTYPQSMIPAPPQGHGAADGQVPALHQGRVSDDEHTLSSTESLLRSLTPDNSNIICEDDTCNVKVEVGNADHYNVFYGMDDQGEQYITSVSRREIDNTELNTQYFREQNEGIEQDPNDQGISAEKQPKEELADFNSDTFHTKEVHSVIGNEELIDAWYEQSEENDGPIPARKQDKKDKCCHKDEMADSKCDVVVTRAANNDLVKDIEDVNMTQAVEQDLDYEAFSSEGSNFQCSACAKMFASASTLELHKKSHNNEKPFQCLGCPKSFSLPSTLNEHMMIHTGEKLYQCLICPEKFSRSKDLIWHIKKSHPGEKPHQCLICSKKISGPGDLTRHERMHTGEKPYQCLVCPKSFSQPGGLFTHKKIHAGKKSYQCSQCSKRFIMKSHLNWHIKKNHTGEKPNQCLICSKKFSRLGDLTRHERMHTGEKPYQCLVCPKSFSQPGGLITHKIIHTGEKPFKCAQCSKMFSRLGDLTRHERMHTGEKPYQCLVCPKSFSQPGGLFTHKMLHTGEKPFKCAQCSKRFILKSHLTRHKNSHH